MEEARFRLLLLTKDDAKVWDAVKTVEFVTPACSTCGKRTALTLDYDSYLKWRSGVLIQDAFPSMSDAEREVLKTGIHPDCWNTIFAHEFRGTDIWKDIAEENFCLECGELFEHDFHKKRDG